LSFVCSHSFLLHSCFSLFFFSSRRRHTRSKRDWSSDVCSSDLHFSGQSSPYPSLIVGISHARPWPHEHPIPHVGSWMHLLSRRSHVRVLARPDHTVVRHREVVRWHRVQRARRREQWNEGSVLQPQEVVKSG